MAACCRCAFILLLQLLATTNSTRVKISWGATSTNPAAKEDQRVEPPSHNEIPVAVKEKADLDNASAHTGNHNNTEARSTWTNSTWTNDLAAQGGQYLSFFQQEIRNLFVDDLQESEEEANVELQPNAEEPLKAEDDVVDGLDVLPTPVVLHYKAQGGIYLKDSPLYNLQEANKSLSTTVPVSISMKCIINLMAQFFFVYTALFVFQVLNRLGLIAREQEEALLCRVAETVFLVPMLCVAFLTVRIQAVELTHGQTEKYELPPWWVKAAMVGCTGSVMVHTFVVCVLTLVGHDKRPSTKGPDLSQLYVGSGDECAIDETVRRLDNLLRLAKGVAICGVYFTFSVVMAGAFTMHGQASYDGHYDAAIFSSICLTILYFLVHLASVVSENTFSTGITGETPRVTPQDWYGPFRPGAIRDATSTVAIAPMLCVFFLATRSRVLELGGWAWSGGQTALGWDTMQYACCVVSVSLLLLTFLSALGHGQGREVQTAFNPSSPYTTVKASSGFPRVMRVSATAVLYLGLILIGMEVADMDGGEDGNSTLSTTLVCIFVLSGLYFSVYGSLFIISGIDAARPVDKQGDYISILKTFLGVRVKDAVSFCPMFCILFLGALVRARQLGNGHVGAEPQPWCLKVEVVATATIFVLTIARVDAILPPSWYLLANMCSMLQYICLSFLYMSAIAIVVGLFIMTPETALGRHVPLVEQGDVGVVAMDAAKVS